MIDDTVSIKFKFRFIFGIELVGVELSPRINLFSIQIYKALIIVQRSFRYKIDLNFVLSSMAWEVQIPPPPFWLN